MRSDEKSQIRVLLVEDDEDDFILTQGYLSAQPSQKFQMDWAQNYTEGLDAVKKRGHDVFLLDYRLGSHDGMELLKEALDEDTGAPIIMLTGMDDHNLGLEAIKAGAADYLVKGELTAGLLGRSIHYALERTNLMAEIKAIALRDELTCLFNRREMLRILRHELDRHLRYGTIVSLIILDVDGLKRINDTYGHPAGDKLIQLMAQRMEKNFRSTDCLARYGGDEFVVVLPETDGAGAYLLAERLRQAIFLDRFELCDLQGNIVDVELSASMGIAECPGDTDNLEGLLQAADQALYHSKQHGGNQAHRA